MADAATTTTATSAIDVAATSEQGNMVSGEGYISDESDFYGGDEVCAKLEAELAERGGRDEPWSAKFWEYQSRMPATMAWIATRHAGQQRHGSSSASGQLFGTEKGGSSAMRFHNQMEGMECARQTDESIDDFLTRLPPSTSTLEDVGPEIWCMNPHSAAPKREDKAGFLAAGTDLLASYKALQEETAEAMKGKAKSVVDRKLWPKRVQLEKDIKAAAQEHGVVAGKWMLFPSVDVLDATWKQVADHTWKGYLGTGAKVVTQTGGQREANARLICVYTHDFAHVKDVKRVCEALSRMGVVDAEKGKRKAASKGSSSGGGGGIWYKCDAYTHLGIESGNEYGLRASLYGSRDMLKKD